MRWVSEAKTHEAEAKTHEDEDKTHEDEAKTHEAEVKFTLPVGKTEILLLVH